MFTFLLASLFLWIIERSYDRPKLLLWIPLLFLFWLNLHAGFALGPALIFLYAAGVAWEGATGVSPWSDVRPVLLRLVAAIIVCLALVPFNPNGITLYRYPLDTLRSSGIRKFIVEWFSPDFHQSLYTPLLLVLVLLLISLAWSCSSVRARVLLPLVAMCLAALDAVRHIPIFILVAMPVIAGAFPHALRSAQLRLNRPGKWHFRRLFNVGAIVMLALFALVRWTTLSLRQNALVRERFPQRAVMFLRTGTQPGRIFAYYDWGGYVIWSLYPRYRVFLDGRSDLYWGKFLEEAMQTVSLDKGWHATLDDWNVDTVLMPPTAALAQALALDSRWTPAYRDGQAVVFVRNRAGAQVSSQTLGY